MLQVADLRVAYSGVLAVHDATLSVGDQELIAVIGPNGAGKTSLLKAISGTVQVKHGSISFDGADLLAVPPHRRVDLGIVHVPQGRRVFATISVRDNLLLGAHRHAARPLLRERLALVAELFPPLTGMMARDAGALSGGQQQMLAIARGLMSVPRLLLLDEPSMGLAPVVTENIFAAIAKIRELEGIAIVLVEQQVRDALELADRGYVMESGSVLASGSAAELLHDETLVETYLGAASTESPSA